MRGVTRLLGERLIGVPSRRNGGYGGWVHGSEVDVATRALEPMRVGVARLWRLVACLLVVGFAASAAGCAGQAADVEAKSAAFQAGYGYSSDGDARDAALESAAAPDVAEESAAPQPEPPPPPAPAMSLGGSGVERPASTVPAKKAPPDPQAREQAAPTQAPDSPAVPIARRQLLIYTADITMAVFEVEKSLDAVEELVEQQDGYVVQRGDGSIVVRIPAGRFDATVEALKPLGDVLHRDIRVDDVTAEFRDLEVQLQTLDAMRKRFEQLLAKAQNVEEALAVERELQRVITESERIKGRLKVLGELIAFSTITVRFEARPVDMVRTRVNLPFPWLRTLGLPSLLDMGGE